MCVCVCVCVCTHAHAIRTQRETVASTLGKCPKQICIKSDKMLIYFKFSIKHSSAGERRRFC